IVKEELNLKEVSIGVAFDSSTKAPKAAQPETELDTKLTPALKREGMMREVVRNVQNARKQAGLEVNDRIHVSLSSTDDELRKAIHEHHDVIATETLATKVVFDQTFAHNTVCSVDDAPLTISLEKA